MINQVKQLTHGLLTAGLLGCGVASEVATHHPSAAPVSSPAVEPAGERPTQVPGRPGAPRPPAPTTTATVLAAEAPRPLAVLAARQPAAPTTTSEAALLRESVNESALGTANRRIQAGRILDEAGAPLVGATVLLKGTSRGTSTDANGDYSLPVPLGTNTFVFAYSGYQEEVAQSRDGQPLTVTLLPIPGLAPATPAPKNPRLPKAHRREVQR